MVDKDEVIRGLKCCYITTSCDGCPYAERLSKVALKTPDNYCPILDDVLTLLKEQEVKEVIESTNMYTGLPITHCPKCGVSIDRYLYGRQHEGQINHCPFCGQAVKWK